MGFSLNKKNFDVQAPISLNVNLLWDFRYKENLDSMITYIQIKPSLGVVHIKTIFGESMIC